MSLKKYLFILLIGGAVCSPFSVFSQKKKQQDKIVLTQKDSLQLDVLFIDATAEFLNGNFRDAIKTYEDVKKSYPNDATIYHQIAKCHNGLESVGKAIQHEEIAIELAPENKYYYLYLAELYRKAKAWNELAVCYEEMLKNTKGTAKYHYELGHLYTYFFQSEKRKYVYLEEKPNNNYLTQRIPKKERKKMDKLVVKALTEYKLYGDFFGVDEELVQDRQEILTSSGQVELAVKEGEVLVNKYPERVSYVIRNSQLYSRNKQYQKAIDYLLKKQKSKNDYRIVLALISNYEKIGATDKVNENIKALIKDKTAPLSGKKELLIQLVKSAKGEEEMKYVLDLAKNLEQSHPEDSQTKFLLADIYFFKGDMSNARNTYLLALEKDGANNYGWEQVLNIDVNQNDYTALKKDASKAVFHFKEEAIFHYWLATAYLHQKENEKAIQSFLNASELTKNAKLLVRIYAEMGDAYHRIKAFDKSDKAYEEALIYSPNNAYVLNNYSYYLSLRKEHLHKAKSMAKRLVLLNPNEPAYLDTYGWVLYQLKQYKEASLYLEKAVSQTKSGTIFEHYGDVLYQLNKIDDSVVWWKKAKKAGVKTLEIDKKIKDKKLYEK